MLDNETKRRIDTARDVLVGKVPDPKSQVEQITIALIYKFMDDMDKEAVEMGGKASFFAGDYQKYAWSKIFAPQLGGFEMLALYADAITRMAQNPNLPQLFRDIFKNAYLPYRDPETLKLFLKTINDFSYDHSERLGDAFEYLLSVLGSQGDAGQFRTPRHIIDFMVQVVAPQKNDTILDPACGTAGFLISSFKYILKANTKKIPGDGLTTDERKKLLANFKGYDISPDMVRLSLVNLYLHGFVQPQILEYDTLSSEDRWNEYADVIMANPPFMSPKGGIKPHKKFSVQSNRSEVLFVDYIAEHLRPTGRAAVIVPEGIIFQSAGAYKQLRKMLVDKYLYAVVSLPAGVFNPYSGVKTSILFLDVQLARKTDAILFVKIENDGFGLGAQRREMAGSDLPDAANILADYIKASRSGTLDTFKPEGKPCCALLVKKETLAENGEYNLTGERYRIAKRKVNQKWPMVELKELCAFVSGFAFKSENLFKEPPDNSFLPVIKIGSFGNRGYVSATDVEYHKYSNELEKFLVRKGDIVIAMTGATVGKTAISQYDNFLLNQRVGLVRSNEKTNQDYLRIMLFSDSFYDFCQKTAGGGAQGNISPSYLQDYKIPFPPPEVQREIVAEIEGHQKLIDGARQVVENWKPQIDIDPEWPMVKLAEIIDDIETGVSVNSINRNIVEGEIGILKTSAVTYGVFKPEEHKAVLPDEITRVKCNPKKNSIIISRMNTEAMVGASAYIDKDYSNLYLPDRLWQTAINRKDVNVKYLHLIISSDSYRKRISDICGGTSGSMKNISKTNFLGLSIPLPPLTVQREIIAKIEAERKAIDGCRELIAIYEAKIKQVIDKVWED